MNALLKATRTVNLANVRPVIALKALGVGANVIQNVLLAYCHLPDHNMGLCDTWGYKNNEILLKDTSACAYMFTSLMVKTFNFFSVWGKSPTRA